MEALFILGCALLAAIILIVCAVIGNVIYWQYVDGWIGKNSH